MARIKKTVDEDTGETLNIEILPPEPMNKNEHSQPKRGRSRKSPPAASVLPESDDTDEPEIHPPGEDEPIPDAVFGPNEGREDDVSHVDTPLVEKPDRREPNDKPKAGPPTLDEWQDFIGRVVLRTLTQGYIALVLGDLEDELTPSEREQISLSKDDLRELASPMASLANKNKYTRKHGRAIISATESWEAGIVLLLWMRRVNRIANRHKAQHAEQEPVEGQVIQEGVNGHGRPHGKVPGQGAQFPAGGIYRPGTPG